MATPEEIQAFEQAQQLKTLAKELEALREECDDALAAIASGNLHRLSKFRGANIWEINRTIGRVGQ